MIHKTWLESLKGYMHWTPKHSFVHSPTWNPFFTISAQGLSRPRGVVGMPTHLMGTPSADQGSLAGNPKITHFSIRTFGQLTILHQWTNEDGRFADGSPMGYLAQFPESTLIFLIGLACRRLARYAEGSLKPDVRIRFRAVSHPFAYACWRNSRNKMQP